MDWLDKTALFNRLVDAWTKVDPASSPYTTPHTREFKLFCEAMGLSVKYTEGVGIELTDANWYKEQWQSIAGKANLKHLVESKEKLEAELAEAREELDLVKFERDELKGAIEQIREGHLQQIQFKNELYGQLAQAREELEKLKYKYEFEMTAGAQCELVLKQQITDLEQALSRCAEDNENLGEANKELKEHVDHWKRAHDAAIGSPFGGDTNDVAEYWHDKWKEADERLYPLLSELEATKLRELLRMAQWSDAIGTLSESVEREAKLVEALEFIESSMRDYNGAEEIAREALEANAKARGDK